MIIYIYVYICIYIYIIYIKIYIYIYAQMCKSICTYECLNTRVYVLACLFTCFCVLYVFIDLISIARKQKLFAFFRVWWSNWISAVLHFTLTALVFRCIQPASFNCKYRAVAGSGVHWCASHFPTGAPCSSLLRHAFRLGICHLANLLLGNSGSSCRWCFGFWWPKVECSKFRVFKKASIEFHKSSWKQLPAPGCEVGVVPGIDGVLFCSKWSWLKPRHFNLRLKCAGRRKPEASRGRGCPSAACRAGLVIFAFRTNQVWIEVIFS